MSGHLVSGDHVYEGRRESTYPQGLTCAGQSPSRSEAVGNQHVQQALIIIIIIIIITIIIIIIIII